MDDPIQKLTAKLKHALDPLEIEVTDNSWRHAGHMQANSALAATHLQLTLISPKFQSISLLDRHRWVHRILQEEMNTHLHALELATYTPEEWSRAN